MKKLLSFSFFIFLISFSIHCSAQSAEADTLKKELALAKADSTKFNILEEIAGQYLGVKQDSLMHYLKLELALANLDNNIKWKAIAYFEYGRSQYVSGNYPVSLQWELKSLQFAESINDSTLMAYIDNFIGITYKEDEDYDKAKRYFLECKRFGETHGDFGPTVSSYENLGEVYDKINMEDSALFYTQQGYALLLKKGVTPSNLLVMLGNIQKKLHNKNLALDYYRLGIENLKKESAGTRNLSKDYLSFADFYNQYGETDSAIYFAHLSISTAKRIPYLKGISTSARFLSAIYDSLHQPDSAFYYQSIFVAANDSLNSRSRAAEVENLSMLEQIRQQEKELAVEKAKEERWLNIQYALIFLGIITFLILFLLLARSVIIHERLIKLLGVIALLIIFEFLNLLLHPFFGRITNENPLLMLLALVAMAAILVPLHHRLEKWATTRLVEKNKQIRLAAAKKTIEKLEHKKPET